MRIYKFFDKKTKKGTFEAKVISNRTILSVYAQNPNLLHSFAASFLI